MKNRDRWASISFKVGVKIYYKETDLDGSNLRRNGRVIKVLEDSEYPVIVKYDDGAIQAFTKDGRYWLGEERTLHPIKTQSKEVQNRLWSKGVFRGHKLIH